MTTVKIFVSSSIKFIKLREDIELFFSSKNKIFKDRLYFEVCVCGDFDNPLDDIPTQEKYNRAINTCDYMLLFYSNRVGKYTLEEYIHSIKNNVKTYVYKLPDNISELSIEDKDSVTAFNAILEDRNYFMEYADNVDQLLNKFYGNIERNDILNLILLAPTLQQSYFLSKNIYKINRENEVLYFADNISDNLDANCTLFLYKATGGDQPNYYNYRLDQRINGDNLNLTTDFGYIDVNRIFDVPEDEKWAWFSRFLDELNTLYATKFVVSKKSLQLDNLTQSFCDLLSNSKIKQLILPFKIEGLMFLNNETFVKDVIDFLSLFDFVKNNGSGISLHFVFNLDADEIKDTLFFKQVQNKFQVNQCTALKPIFEKDISNWAKGYSNNDDENKLLTHKIVTDLKDKGFELPNQMSKIDLVIRKIITTTLPEA